MKKERSDLMVEFKRTTDLNDQVYLDALALRTEVFVKEQNVSPTDEIDHEQGPLYFVGYLNSQPVVTARVIEEDAGIWHIQRVAVKSEFRKRSLGTEVLREIENVADSKHIQLLTLGAQDQAQNFYLKLGYQVKGAGFLDAGIKHHRMDKILD